MTQIRPRLDEDLAAEVKAYGDSLNFNFNLTVRILLRIGLQNAPGTHDGVVAALKGGSDERAGHGRS